MSSSFDILPIVEAGTEGHVQMKSPHPGHKPGYLERYSLSKSSPFSPSVSFNIEYSFAMPIKYENTSAASPAKNFG